MLISTVKFITTAVQPPKTVKEPEDVIAPAETNSNEQLPSSILQGKKFYLRKSIAKLLCRYQQ
jgi:hypothetical protein